MLYYLNSHGSSIQEYLAENGEYIGILGSKEDNNIKPSDISLDKINEHLLKNEFLVCCILNGSWWVALIFNTKEGATEIKLKYKGKPMLWYWVKRHKIEECLPHIKLKEFENEFGKNK